MKISTLLVVVISLFSVSLAHAIVFTGAMDNRALFPNVPGLTAQTRAWVTGNTTGGGVRLEWQVDNETSPGEWTYTYRMVRGTLKNKGFAFFDIETANDFTAADIISRQVISATDRNGDPIPSGLASITISNPVNFNAVHDFSNAAVTETSVNSALDKTELSQYSGDPGRLPPGQPGDHASATPSVGPVPHPFYGLRVTFPGSFLDLAYEADEWEFRIVADRPPMWGKMFGWGDQTTLPPYFYANFFNDFIDSPDRLALAPANSLTGAGPYHGWVLVPGTLPSVTSTNPAGGAVQVPVTEPVTAVFSGLMDPTAFTAGSFTLVNTGGGGSSGAVSGTASYDQASKTATFQPASPLSPGATYTATIAAGISDLSSGNTLPVPTTWSFTTAVLDTTPPSVTATLPGNGDTYVATTTAFKATFSEAIDPATLTAATFSVAGASGTVTYDPATRTATLTPTAPLANNTVYTATISTGVTDLAGNPLPAPFHWDVTTIPLETVLPFVDSTFPADRATNVVTTTTVSATFSEQIDPSTLTPGAFFVAGVAGTTTYDPASRTATITPAAPLASNTSYTLTVTTGVKDLAGNPVGLSKGFVLRTVNTQVPNFSASGTITDPSGSPIPGVSVQVRFTGLSGTSPQVAVTNAAGQYTATQLLNSAYSFTPSRTGYVFLPKIISSPVTANVTGLNFTGGQLTLTPDKTSPQAPGTTVLFTAASIAGIDYRFWFYNGTSWSMVQNYGNGNTWTLPASTPAGSYVVAVDARSVASVDREAVTYTNFEISGGPATGVTISPASPSPHAAGTAVAFTAAGQGSAGYDYRFWLFNGSTWNLVQNYGNGAVWTMPAGTPTGSYVVAVDVRTTTEVNRDAVAYLGYEVTSGPATSVDVVPDQPSPHAAGTAVQFTATGHGSAGYDYRFWLFDGSSWTMVQDYGNGNSWTLPASATAGNYVIAVDVRTSSEVYRDTVTYFSYQVI